MANATTETNLEPLDFVAPRDGMVCGHKFKAGDTLSLRRSALLDEWRVRIGNKRGEWLEIPLLSGYSLYGNEHARVVHAELVALRDSVKPTETFPERVMRVAREAGYEPTGAETTQGGLVLVSFAYQTASDYTPGVLMTGYDEGTIIAALRTWAGPDNQPEAVRAREAKAHLAAISKANPWMTFGEQSITPTLTEDPQPDPKPIPMNDRDRAIFEEMFGNRAVMVNEIIARQVAAGGVDTEGSRHEAERWCAMLCGCVCEGMRATTRMSAYRMAFGRGGTRADWAGYTEECGFRGKPLGRP